MLNLKEIKGARTSVFRNNNVTFAEQKRLKQHQIIMKKSSKLLLLALAAITLPATAQEKTPAFPGAEGFGRYTTGGRGGAVYHVTNLNDSGTGSLRWALGQNGAKTIVFDVSGTIHLNSALNIGSNTTIAGQTAPGDGICVADYPCAIKGNNVIVRYMRFRLGNKNVTKDGADGWDGFGGFDQKDWVIDHCSVSWSIDECLSVLGNHNTTVQWCLVSQSLVNSGHSKGAHGYGGNWGGSGASFHHNLLAHHTSRTPRLGPRPTTQLEERMDYRNNVIYNFGGNGCYGGEGMMVNIVNNYYKPGPGSPTGTKGKRIAAVGCRTNQYVKDNPSYAPALHLWGKYFVEGNVNPKYSDVTKDNWTWGIYNQINSSDNDNTFTATTKDTMKLAEPMPFIYTTTHSAEKAYEKVLLYAGACLSRDSHDALMVDDTRNSNASYTGSGLGKGFINSQEDNKPSNAGSDWSAWPTLNSLPAPADSDGDGMPDEWETANGLNPNDKSDGNQTTAEGYTNLEVYLNSIVASITEAQYADGVAEGYIEKAPDPSGNEEGLQTEAEGDIIWEFGSGAEGQTATIGDALGTTVTSNDVSIGSTLQYKGSRAVNGVTFTLVQPSINNEATSNDDNALSFNFEPAAGYFFRPTKITLNTTRIGTDGGLVDIFWKNSNGKHAIDAAISPERNNSGYTSYSKDISDISSAEGPSSLMLCVYKLGNSKQVGFANVTISGQMKKSTDGIEEVEAATISTSGNVYNLQGQKVTNPHKGIYIINKKKVVIKD